MPSGLHGYIEPIQTINILFEDLLYFTVMHIRAENHFFKRAGPPEPLIDSDSVGSFSPTVRLSGEIHIHVRAHTRQLSGIVVPMNAQVSDDDTEIREWQIDQFPDQNIAVITTGSQG